MYKKYKQIFLLLFLSSCLSSNNQVFRMACDLGDKDCGELSQVIKIMSESLNLTYGKLEDKILELDTLCDANNHYACRAVSAYHVDNFNYLEATKYLEKVCNNMINLRKDELIDACDEASKIYRKNLNDDRRYINLQKRILYLQEQEELTAN